MCGILAILGKKTVSDVGLREYGLSLSSLIRHRGPDWTGAKVVDDCVLCHERLSIVGLNSGNQPITIGDVSVIVNGEIYNHREIRALLGTHFKTQSDSEVIIHLYNELKTDFLPLLDGMFAFILIDHKNKKYLAGRDPIGLTSFYMGKGDGLFFSSELKCLKDCEEVIVFPPAHYSFGSFDEFELVPYFACDWMMSSKLKLRGRFLDYYKHKFTIPEAPILSIKHKLQEAVFKRIPDEVPYAVLLSGGLDSSLVAAIAAKRGKIRTFSIGLNGSPDLEYAQLVADFLKTDHSSIEFSEQEGLDALSSIVYHLETYDVTTIRASIPMYLLSRCIRSLGIKVVLSGEGSDEIFGGYLYFHSAPTHKEFHEESVSRVCGLHCSDCLRANKSTMAWGLEARVPYLDLEFLNLVMNIDPEHKRCSSSRIEKHILRESFTGELPDAVLWRQKEQFSDGVGYNWIDTLKQYSEALVKDEDFEKRAFLFPFQTPETKEAFYYRTLFEKYFPNREKTVIPWSPRTDWGCASDPSGRAQDVHIVNK